VVFEAEIRQLHDANRLEERLTVLLPKMMSWTIEGVTEYAAYNAGLRKPSGLSPLLRSWSLIKAKIPAVTGALADVLNQIVSPIMIAIVV
jgi:hypothetical protein